MHDLKAIRDNPAAFDAGLARRGLPPLSSRILELDARRRAGLQRGETAQATRKQLSRQIGQAKAQGKDAADLLADVARLESEVEAGAAEAQAAEGEIKALLEATPNLPSDRTPDGADETGNVETGRFGAPRNFAFDPKDHVAIGEGLGLMDFATASKLSGARFVVLKGALARLERALASFMLDVHTGEFGYLECNPPLLVRDEVLYGTGQLPKFAGDQFTASRLRSREELLHDALKHAPADAVARYREGAMELPDLVDAALDRAPAREDLWLIPTAEVALTNFVAGEILDEKQLPMRLTAWTPCFRSEAGAAGRDTRGMIRQHQFHKVELVSICRPEDSAAEHERMTKCAETILERLDLPYRRMALCAGDMGFGAQATFDLEVWLPGQNAYREISSCSVCGDFQARRMGARFRRAGQKGTEFVHTLNGSGLAVGRTLVAVLENYQNEDGSVTIPAPLRPYMGGLDTIVAGAAR